MEDNPKKLGHGLENHWNLRVWGAIPLSSAMTYENDILRLRSLGKSYKEISKDLGCSKSTVSYYLGVNQKSRTKERTEAKRNSNPLYKSYTFFLYRTYESKTPSTLSVYTKTKTGFSLLKQKLRDFQRIVINGRLGIRIVSFSYEELIDKFETNPVCYLTGRPLSLSDTEGIHLDHIIPRSKGGSNDLDNLGFTCVDANLSKRDLSLEQFLGLCVEIVENNGYTVKPIESDYDKDIDKQIDDLYHKIAELKKQKQEYLDTPKDLT